MLKLLTEKEKIKVAHEYGMRRAIVMILALLGILVVSVIGQMPSYILTSSRYNDVVERTRINENSVEKENKAEAEAWLKETNAKLKAINPKLDTDRPSLFVENLVGAKGAGIRLTGLSWVKSKNEIILTATGVATDRQSLINFESRINASGHFSGVSVPVSNLAEDRDIDFQIKFSPKKEP